MWLYLKKKKNLAKIENNNTQKVTSSSIVGTNKRAAYRETT